MSQRVGGVLSFFANNKAYELEGSATYSTQKFMRTTVNSLTKGVAGHKREATTPFLDGTFVLTPDVDVTELQGLENVTCQMNLFNGKVVVIYRAAQIGQIEVDAAEGTFPLRMEGDDGIVIQPA
jgi:hypothetical protein